MPDDCATRCRRRLNSAARDVSDAARAIALGAVPITLFFGGPALPLLAAVAVIDGAFDTFFTVAWQACLPRIVSSEQLPHALAVDTTSDQLSHLVGPTLSGVLYTLGRSIPCARILGAMAAPRLQRRLGVGRLLILASWIWVLTWPPFALAPDLGWLAVVNAIGWIIVPIHGITQLSYRLNVIPDELQGRVNSVYRLLAFGGQPLALAISGLLLQTVGPVMTVWLITLPQLILIVAATLRGSSLFDSFDAVPRLA